MAWCFSTRASVAMVLTMHPCVSQCLRVKLTKDAPYLTLTDKLQGVYWVDLGENLWCYNGIIKQIMIKVNWSNSQIPQCTCLIPHNALLRTEMCTFLFWMVHCGIWGRSILRLVYSWWAHDGARSINPLIKGTPKSPKLHLPLTQQITV